MTILAFRSVDFSYSKCVGSDRDHLTLLAAIAFGPSDHSDAAYNCCRGERVASIQPLLRPLASSRIILQHPHAISLCCVLLSYYEYVLLVVHVVSRLMLCLPSCLHACVRIRVVAAQELCLNHTEKGVPSSA